MQVQFMRPVTLSSKDGKTSATFGKGAHSVDEDMATGWFFEGLVKEGSAVVLGGQPVAVETEEDKNPKVPAKAHAKKK